MYLPASIDSARRRVQQSSSRPVRVPLQKQSSQLLAILPVACPCHSEKHWTTHPRRLTVPTPMSGDMIVQPMACPLQHSLAPDTNRALNAGLGPAIMVGSSVWLWHSPATPSQNYSPASSKGKKGWGARNELDPAGCADSDDKLHTKSY